MPARQCSLGAGASLSPVGNTTARVDAADMGPHRAQPTHGRTRAARSPVSTTPCAVRIAGQRCGAPVPGVDPCRPCDACRLRGAPARLPWELAKPDDAALVGETVHHQGA